MNVCGKQIFKAKFIFLWRVPELFPFVHFYEFIDGLSNV